MKRPGRPPRNIIVPDPLRGDRWLQIGGYDKHWPAVNRYAILLREGASKRDALTKAAAEFEVEEQSIVDWLRRRRKRGPIAQSDN
jgi:hypothetical protein